MEGSPPGGTKHGYRAQGSLPLIGHPRLSLLPPPEVTPGQWTGLLDPRGPQVTGRGRLKFNQLVLGKFLPFLHSVRISFNLNNRILEIRNVL